MAVTSTTNELPGNLNLTIYQGATFITTLTWTQDDVAVDLTGYTGSMKVKTGATDIIDLTTANGRITLGGTAGTVTLTLTAAETAALSQANAEYDLLLTSGSNVVYPLVAGLVTIRPSITAG